MESSPVLDFGRYRGKPLASASDDYLRWLADPARHGTDARGRRFKPLPEHIVEEARRMVEKIDAARLQNDHARRVLSGADRPGEHTLYVFECDGDMHSASGTFAFDLTVHASLDAAFAILEAEYPRTRDDPGQFRETPDPEDDRILLWEVLPSGHRKVVWAFTGWHHSSDEFACGQGRIPGDPKDLYDLANV